MNEFFKRIEGYIAIMAKNTLDINEAALYLGITPDALRNKLPSIPHYRSKNGRNYFKKAELDDYRCGVYIKPAKEIEIDALTSYAISKLQ